MVIGRFYGGVGALIWRESDGRYLLLKRAGDKDYASGVWECVTGRVDQGEGFEEAVYREVAEEIGASINVEFVVGTTHFYRGELNPEHELIGVVFACTLMGPNEIHLSAEHSDYRWVAAEEVSALAGASDPSTAWIRRVVARTEALRALYSPELVAFHRRHGFNLDDRVNSPDRSM